MPDRYPGLSSDRPDFKWPIVIAGIVLCCMCMPRLLTAEGGEYQDPAAFEEIVVTARKVAESVQDIPMSIQVLSAGFLDTANLSSFYELQFNIPGLVVNNLGLNGAGFALRGITDQGGTNSSIATHLDGVYLGRSSLALTRLFDLERVEVLKGPQGTLYGRNSTGGSINFITRAPQDELSSEVEAAYGSYDTVRLQGHLNVPFDQGAFRLAFIGSEGDGYIRNSIDDRTFGESDFWGVRAALRWNASDKLLIDLMAQHVTDDGGTGELWGPPPQFLVDPDDIRLTTVYLADPYLEMNSDTISLNVEYELGFAMLHSITGFASNEVRDLDDCSGAPFLAGCIRSVDPSRFDQWSQEIQLASQDNSSLTWLAGAYFFHGDQYFRFYNIIPVLSPVPRNDYAATAIETAYAAFGQTAWQFAEHWSLTGGLRLGHESSSASDQGVGSRDNPTLTSAENDWNNLSWRLDLEYIANANLVAYGSVSTGYKSGGVTTRQLPDGKFDSFEPEDLTAVEVGMKSQWPNQEITLNAAAFYYDFRDLQISSTFIFDGQLITDVENSAKAEIYGLDVSGDFQPTDQLTLSGGFVWMPKREFVEFVSEWTGDSLSGNTMSRAPEWSATVALNYEYALGDPGLLSMRLEYNYRSSYFFTKENDPLLEQESFGLLNLFLTFEDNSGKWRIFAIGRNLTNADYYNQIFLQSSPGYPATYEVGFAVSF